jgi:hypothetical protein
MAASSTLLRSQLECPRCHDIVASIHRHDFQQCSCGGIFLDGGRDYMRCGGESLVVEDGSIQHMDRSLFIAGNHNDASAALALSIYKALWQASHRGTRPASTTEVIDLLAAKRVGRPSVMAYLKSFSDDEDSPVAKTGDGVRQAYSWLPKVPLAEREDAPV